MNTWHYQQAELNRVLRSFEACIAIETPNCCGDGLQRELVRELADTVAIRASATCRADTAKAVGKYLGGHKHDAGSLQESPLDRAMATTCP